MDPQPSPPPPHGSRLLVALGLTVVTALAFLSVVGLPYIGFDDLDYVLENPMVRGGLTPTAVAWAFTGIHSGNWHPLTSLSHLLDVTVFGLGPAGPHTVNLILHCANAALLFLLFERLTGATWRSALLAAIFALHPLRVESVAWVAERKDVLSTLLWLATTHAYVGWVRARAAWRYGLVVCLFALGLASKPMLVTLPFTLLLLDFWPLARIGNGGPWRSTAWPLVKEKLPLFALSAASSAITLIVQRSAGAVKPLAEVPAVDRLIGAGAAVLGYLGKFLWPASLAVFYPRPEGRPGPLVLAWIALALASAFGIAAIAWKRFPFVTVGWLWFVGTLVPVIGLVQVGAQSMADRYTYVPGIGLAMIVAWAVPSPPRFARAHIAVAATLLLVGLALLTGRQIGYWTSEARLFQHALEVTERNWLADMVLGMNLERQGDLPGAIVRYRRALQVNPTAPEALLNLGGALVRQGRPSEAIPILRVAVQTWPGYTLAVANLGAALSEAGDPQQALPFLGEAVRRDPGLAPARYNLALALERVGDRQAATAEMEAYVRLAPFDPDGRAQLQRMRSGAVPR